MEGIYNIPCVHIAQNITWRMIYEPPHIITTFFILTWTTDTSFKTVQPTNKTLLYSHSCPIKKNCAILCVGYAFYIVICVSCANRCKKKVAPSSLELIRKNKNKKKTNFVLDLWFNLFRFYGVRYNRSTRALQNVTYIYKF